MDRKIHISMMACAAACVVACTDTAHGAVTTAVDLDMVGSPPFSHRDNTVSGVTDVRVGYWGSGQESMGYNTVQGVHHDHLDTSNQTTTVSEHEYEGASWNPGTDGAINSISFSIDARFGHWQGGPVLDPSFLDGISFFVTDGTNTAYSESFTLSNDNWNTLSTGALTSSDLAGIDFTGTNNLTFGYRVQTTSSGTKMDVFTTILDNFSVSIDYTASVAPTPGSIAIMGLSGCLYFRRSRS